MLFIMHAVLAEANGEKRKSVYVRIWNTQGRLTKMAWSKRRFFLLTDGEDRICSCEIMEVYRLLRVPRLPT